MPFSGKYTHESIDLECEAKTGENATCSKSYLPAKDRVQMKRHLHQRQLPRHSGSRKGQRAGYCNSQCLKEALILSDELRWCRAIRRPHLFYIIESADFWAENVNDCVTDIDEHPVTVRHTLNAGITVASIL